MDQARTYKWIQDRLRELHSGTLSEQDRARLWAMADEDPFVADALEGYQKHPDTSHTEHLDVLARKIILQKRDRRRWLIPNLAVTAIAASLIIIVGTWAVINRMDKKDETLFVFVSPDSLEISDTVASDIAINEDATIDAKTSSPTSDPSGSVAHSPLKAKDETYNREKQKAGETKPIESDASKKESDKNVVAEPTLAETSELEEKMADDQPVTPPATIDGVPYNLSNKSLPAVQGTEKSKLDQGYYANQMDPDLMARRVTGRVVEAETGEPLIFVNLLLSYTNQPLYTDLEGNFEILIPESEAVMQVKYTGYQDSIVIVKKGDEGIIVGLKTGAMIPPLVIVTENNSRSKPVALNPAIEAFLKFRNHITTSSQFPLSFNLSSGLQVTVGFKVNSAGRPKEIKIIDSCGQKPYDDEAMRLIQTGPDWVCPGGVYPCTRIYTFHYQ